MGYHLSIDIAQDRNSTFGHFLGIPKTHTPVSRLQGRGHRYYSPSLGRWLNRDPIGELAFFSRYAQGRSRGDISVLRRHGRLPAFLFVLNNPQDNFDPLGLSYCVTWTDPFMGGTYTACYTDPTPPDPPSAWSCCHNQCKPVFKDSLKSCIENADGIYAGLVLSCLSAGDPDVILACEAAADAWHLATVIGCPLSASVDYASCVAGCLSAPYFPSPAPPSPPPPYYPFPMPGVPPGSVPFPGFPF